MLRWAGLDEPAAAALEALLSCRMLRMSLRVVCGPFLHTVLKSNSRPRSTVMAGLLMAYYRNPSIGGLL
jgi:hypothetical protein